MKNKNNDLSSGNSALDSKDSGNSKSAPSKSGARKDEGFYVEAEEEADASNKDNVSN